MTRPRSRSVFGDRLRQELDRQGMSVRKLARQMNPKSPENMRRQIAKWIKGDVRPSPASRTLVADALGLDHAHFDEDEEDDSEVAELVQLLLIRIDRRVDEVVTSRIDELVGRAVAG